MSLEDERNPGKALDDSLEPSVKTSHPRVFYATEADRYQRGELSIASKIADRFPSYTVIITMGPWRDYDVAYRLKPSEKRILLDFYSVHLPSNSDIVDIMEEMSFRLGKLEMNDEKRLIDGELLTLTELRGKLSGCPTKHILAKWAQAE